MDRVTQLQEDMDREIQDGVLKEIKEDVKCLLHDNRFSHDSLTLTRCNLDHLDCLVSGLDFKPLYDQVNELDSLLEGNDERAV